MKPSIVLMGSKPGSVVALNILLNRGWDVKFVVVSRKSNYTWLEGPTLEEEANKSNIHVLTQSELPKNISVDFIVSYMFRYRVKLDVIKLGKKGALNFHAGPLPEYGGWAFYNLAILENAKEYGCTCHFMDEGFDTGPLLKVNRFPINANEETAYSLERKAQQEMIKLFVEFCQMAEMGGTLPQVAQDPAKVRYLNQSEFEKLKEIPMDADEITKQKYARAFWYPPYGCAFVIHNGIKLEIIPTIVKEEVASLLHQDDVKDLYKISENLRE
ncbi:MAG: formyltransferase family protein [Ginsengibacter sp.]